MKPTTFFLGTAWLILLLTLSANSALAERPADLHKRLKDPSPSVRKQAALTLAEANDADAIPVLIDLLAELPAEERRPIEETLTAFAGEWTPRLQFETDDAISRGIRRDAWASWWRRCDGAALLALLGEHTLTPEKRRKVEALVTQLGSGDFKLRENASEQLLAYHRLVLPRLRQAIAHRDAEVAQRAKRLIERIESGPARRLPLAALRLLALRKPPASIEALLAYLPFADDAMREEEVRKALVTLAARNGKPDAALQRALADASPKVRAVAAEVLIEGGSIEGRTAVRQLLAGDVPSVRLRAALALTRAGEREGISVLIDLLPLLSADESGQAEDVLYPLADDAAAEMPEDAKKRSAVWAAWWKANARRIEPSRLRAAPWLDYTVICDNFNNRVFEIDRRGRQRWAIDNVGNPLDAVVLTGQRVLIAETRANRVTERDFHGKILWQKPIVSPVNVQRLSNGHTFIATSHNAIVEVNGEGKEIYSLHNIPGSVMAARRARDGRIVCLTADGQCRILDESGRQLKKFAAGHEGNSIGGIDLRPNGHILIACNEGGKVVEFDEEGRQLRSMDAPGIVTASHLPNGRLLAAMRNPRHIYELDGSGNIVWEYKGAGNNYRARRR
jgi:HEAT repeat protein